MCSKFLVIFGIYNVENKNIRAKQYACPQRLFLLGVDCSSPDDQLVLMPIELIDGCALVESVASS